MKSFAAFGLVLMLLLLLPPPGMAQGTAERIPGKPVPLPRVPSLPCCECLGRTVQLDLSTGQGGGAVDPLWKMNGGPAYITPPVPGWLTPPPPPAKWIQPVASPTPSPNIPAGLFKYTVTFNIPKCTIPLSVVRLDGKFAADNSAKIFLDGSPVASCPGPKCFISPGVVLSVPSIQPGLHTLEIDVKNDEIYSGLLVNAQLKGQCRKEATLP